MSTLPPVARMAVTSSTSQNQLRSANDYLEGKENTGSSRLASGSNYDFNTSQSVGSSSRKSSADSRLSTASSVSSVGAKIPPWVLNLSISHDVAVTYDYDLPCEFTLLGCGVRFHPEQYEEWIAHSISHFLGSSLPSFAVCTFCDGDNSCFRKDWDRELNWRERMIHIGGHLSSCESNEVRPDFWVLEHLKALDLISDDDYAHGLKHSIKPQSYRQANTPREAYLLHKESREQGLWIEHNTRAESRSKIESRYVSRGGNVQTDGKARLKARLKDMSFHELLDLRHQRRLRKEAKQKLNENGQKPPRDELTKEIVISTDEWPSPLDPKPSQYNGTDYQKGPTTSLTVQHLRDRSVSRACFGKEHYLTGSQSASVANLSMSNSDTESSLSAESLDGDNDRIDPIYPRYTKSKAARQVLPTTLQLPPATANAVDCVMREFWSIFNINWIQRVRQHGTSSSPSQESPNTHSRSRTHVSSSSRGTKRLRVSNDNQSSDEDKDDLGGYRILPKAVSNGSDIVLDFACPYRKYNPRKYCVRDWPPCALVPHKDISRVKSHLYKYHLIHQCLRCKTLFDTEELLDDHNGAVESCIYRPGEQIDGITRKVKDQLKSRKKAFKGQTDREIWEQIYQRLFPQSPSPLPSPYFEHVRDHKEDIIQDQEYQDLSNYTNYLTRELPAIVRRMLEVEIGGNLQQPNNVDARALVMSLLPQALDQSFQNYRSALQPVSTLGIGDSFDNVFSHPHETPLAMSNDHGLGLSGIEQLQISNHGGQPSESSSDSGYATQQPSSEPGVAESVTVRTAADPLNDGGCNYDANHPLASSGPTQQGDYTSPQSHSIPRSFDNQHLSLSQPGSSTEIGGDAGLLGYEHSDLNVPLSPWDMHQYFINQDSIDWVMET